MDGISNLWRDIRGELLRVIWPTPRQTVNYTAFVVLMVAITTGLVVVFDTVFNALTSLIHG